MKNRIIISIASGLVAIIVFVILVFTRPYIPTGKTFTIEKGQSLTIIAQRLQSEGVISHNLIFVFDALISGHSKDLKAGTYAINPDAKAYELVQLFSSGKTIPDGIKVTIPEGSTIKDIDAILASAGLSKPRSFLTKQNLKFEGYLFPDTYFFDPYSSVDTIINGMLANFHSKVDGIAHDPFRAIIIASLLEKEVKSADDMAKVAGIIEKRISLGMPLQIDATVAYGVCRPYFERSQYCDTSSVAILYNLNTKSPYNTYIQKGLPMGPIANPGLQAINAALHPQTTDYLYYLTTKDGQVIYSKTYAEHQKARAKYVL